VAENICARLKRLKTASMTRDRRMQEVTLVRKGEVNLMAPGLFSEDWPKPIIANAIDVIARDFAGTLAPLPTLNCSSRAMRTDADKRRAGKKNKIGASYWKASDLGQHMLVGADQYLTYGFLPFYVEPDFDRETPIIRLENPMGVYYELDRFGETRFFAKCWREPAWKIAAQFPEFTHLIIPRDPYSNRMNPEAELEVVRVCDATNWSLILPERGELTLSSYPHGLDRLPVVIAERPGLTEEPQGQFDQVMWVWLAQARLALMQLDAAHKAVNSPTVLPRDALEFSVGPDAIIQTDNPSSVRKVSLDLPAGAFAVAEQLSDQVKMGARMPEGRMGGIDASVITGRGVQALMGGFSTQVAEAQIILGAALSKVTSLCFEMDCHMWPNARKRIQGNTAGEPYDITYTPKTDISDNYSCDVTYGYAAGLSPNQAVVMLLQLRGDKLISRDTFRRQLPFDVDVDDEQRRIDVNDTEDAAMQGLFALLQSLGPMATQGLDPMPVLKAATIFIKSRRDGVPVEEALERAFTPPEPEPAPPAAPGAPRDPLAGLGQGGGDIVPGAVGDIPGVNANGLPTGVAPGQAGLPPGGMPDIATLVAGMRAGRPVMDSTITRRLPTG
jgi:hypothetical protein